MTANSEYKIRTANDYKYKTLRALIMERSILKARLNTLNRTIKKYIDDCARNATKKKTEERK